MCPLADGLYALKCRCYCKVQRWYYYTVFQFLWMHLLRTCLAFYALVQSIGY